MTKRPSIALSMIVKNEAHHLPRLFKSIEGCFDEVHITDTGSTDGTPEIAEKFGAKVHHFSWVDDFSAARQFAFDQVKTDYVAWIDGDDVLENKEAFIRWRDDAMGFADYWLAAYHYGLNEKGEPNCTFMRERVIRNNGKFRWKYFVHEGLVPEPNIGPVRFDYIPTWSVKHVRTASDMAQDRSRNLKIFEKRLSSLDSRMKFYYGKELFENASPMEAFRWLSDAVADETLEMHDRILGIQYACMASMQCGQFARAVQYGMQGLQLAPNRAEFWVVIGDSYTQMNRHVDALPAYAAAKTCQNSAPPGTSFAKPLFTNADCYTFFPRNMMAKIYAAAGVLDRAKAEAEECFKLYNHPESKDIIEKVESQMRLIPNLDDATPCEDIVITCPPTGAYLWDGELYKTKAMGGSETAAIEMAQWMNALSGRKVIIFNPRDEAKTFGGVEYRPMNSCSEYMKANKPYLHIAWRHNFKVTNAPTFLWAHDVTTQGAENHTNYIKMICLTPFHKRYAMAKQGVPEEKIWVTRNGIDPDRFKDGPWEKDPWKFVFSSSPDRGLDRAMIVLDKVREKYPEIKLHVAYGIEHLPKWGHQELHDRLAAMMQERKDWVVYEGAMKQVDLYTLFKSAAYCVQPSDWLETSMISAMERASCGVYQIIRDIAGGADTLRTIAEKGMARLVQSECISDTEYQTYIDETVKAIEEKAYLNMNVSPDEMSWEGVARDWLVTLPEFIQAPEKEQVG